MEISQIWKSVISELEIDLGPKTVGIYLRRSELIQISDKEFKVVFPNHALKDTANARYIPNIKTALEHQLKTSDFSFSLDVATPKPVDQEKLGPLFEIVGQIETIIPPEPSKPIPDPNDSKYAKSKLSHRYIFETYVVGSTNNFAHAAALGIVKNPGKEYNPFFIYGGVGVGKTHLMQAVGNELYRKNPDLRIIYTSAESFMNELIESIQGKSTEQFRKKYRNLDLLMIDDIQLISGKESTQDEIFHTFNSLHQADKQIILTSDRRPDEIEKVEQRIISRFMGGLTVDIQAPDFEMRTAILNEKLQSRGETWDRDTVEYVASQGATNIRELEGTLNKVLAASKLTGEGVSLEFVKKHIGQNRESRGPTQGIKVAPKQVIEAVAKHYGISANDILSDKRDAEFVKPRQVAMFFLRGECQIKLTEIAKLLKRKDHTTVIHGANKIESLYQTDTQIRNDLMSIKRSIWG